MKYYRLFLLFFLFPILLFSQGNEEWIEFNELIQSNTITYSNDVKFTKMQRFFSEKEWDSTLVSAAKILIQSQLTSERKDYVSFFRGYSFQMKRLFEEAIKEFSKISSDFKMIHYRNLSLGEIALEKSDFEKALSYFVVLDSLNTSDNLGIEEGSLKNNIGLCFMHTGAYEKAEPYLLQSVKIQEAKKNNITKWIGSYGNLANAYYEQYKDNLAIEYFLKAYQLAKTSNNFFKESDKYFHRMSTAKNMSAVEENRKDYQKALTYRKEAQQWKDSLNDQNKIYETAQLEKKIAVEKKEQEVQLLEAENKAKEAQNRVYLFSGILLAILLAILFASYNGTKKRNKIITAQKEDLDELNATKDKLFSIVSHDLRSSVNAIKTSNKKLLGNLETQDKTELAQTLQQNSSIVNGAYGLLDNLLNWALLQTKQTYFEMMDLSLYHITAHVAFNYQPILKEKEIAYENSLSKKIQVHSDQESLKIILRNLLDNAIKFSNENGTIHIYAEESSEEYVDLVIEDSGLGMDEETKNELLKDTQLLSKKKHEDILGTGLGLHLVKSMIVKNQGKFNIESELGKGTKMIISLRKSQNT